MKQIFKYLAEHKGAVVMIILLLVEIGRASCRERV